MLKATDSQLFFSKKDALDPRLGDLVRKELPSEGVAILGYPDDEGIKLNGGRVGAAQGPREIRNWLYRMTPHPKRAMKTVADLGDVSTDAKIDQRHESATEHVASFLKAKLQVLSLGGGNDYAYADGLAFLKAHADQKPLIINVDAHFDVRDLSQGPTSGTPFFRLLESDYQFDFIELGIQANCNSKNHWEYVEKKGGRILSMEEFIDSPLTMLDYVLENTGELLLKRRPVFLAIDIDAFAWPYATGSSQSWPLGIEPHKFIPLYQFLLRRMNVTNLGIYEVSPPLDANSGTAKLAAQLAHIYLHHV